MLSAGDKSSFFRVTVVLMKVRSDLYGITILQFFRSAEEHYLCFLKQRLSGSDLYTS